MIKLYNTYTNKLEVFKPINGKEVKMYNCGPTVYSYAHIGNFSSYLMADLLRRYLEYSGYKVKQVKNITDVGHLVADADDGEDKMEKAAREQKKDPYVIARFYEKVYIEDENKMNILEPFIRPRATEHINEMIHMIEVLMKKGYAYETEDGIYFDITKFKDYGKLSGNTLDKLHIGARVEINDKKKHPYDFALWKKLVFNNKYHIMKWDSPWGEGFPGWHIECSAMARKYLGDRIDIHTGGEDNIFPHHECEIAQSEAYSSKKYVNFWIHKRWFFVEGKKMSKSLGNIYTIKDIEDMGYSALDLRYLLLSAHYRAKLNFTKKGLTDAKNNRKKLLTLINELESITKKDTNLDIIKTMVKLAKKRFIESMDNDLNTSAALAVVFDLAKKINKFLKENTIGIEGANLVLSLIKEFNSIFGVLDLNKAHIPANIILLAEERKQSKINKDFKQSDDIRAQILKEGYELRDKPNNEYDIYPVL